MSIIVLNARLILSCEFPSASLTLQLYALNASQKLDACFPVLPVRMVPTSRYQKNLSDSDPHAFAVEMRANDCLISLPDFLRDLGNCGNLDYVFNVNISNIRSGITIEGRLS
jgi:hypothetical protein